jgi:hypothetical protein
MKVFGRFRRIPARAFLLLFIVLIPACSGPRLPQEVRQVEDQDRALWSARAGVYASDEYDRYKAAVEKGRADISLERSKLPWLRNYGAVKKEFSQVLSEGRDLLEKVRQLKAQRSRKISLRVLALRRKVRALDELTLKIDETGDARKDLVKADLLLSEAAYRNEQGEYDSAEEKLARATTLLDSSEAAISESLERTALGKDFLTPAM